MRPAVRTGSRLRGGQDASCEEAGATSVTTKEISLGTAVAGRFGQMSVHGSGRNRLVETT